MRMMLRKLYIICGMKIWLNIDNGVRVCYNGLVSLER